MDFTALSPFFEKMGFDPKLLAHAAGTVLLFRFLAMPFAKSFEVIPKHLEKLAAFVFCVAGDVIAAVASGSKLFPAVSAAAVGAAIAMVVWDMQFKRPGAKPEPGTTLPVKPPPDPDTRTNESGEPPTA